MSRPNWVTDNHLKIMEILEKSGFESYFVGGCVRDFVLNRDPKDVDIATDAKPNQVKELLGYFFEILDIGIDHGTVGVIADNTAVEITSFRKDVETDGRRAVISYASTIQEDSQRRDFTINALYMDRFGKIHDPTGKGLEDIESKILRFVGEPSERCLEDFLRILRFYRFAAKYHFSMDVSSKEACKQHASGLKKISKERIWSELHTILEHHNPKVMVEMYEAGIFSYITQEWGENVNIHNYLSLSKSGEKLKWYTILHALYPKYFYISGMSYRNKLDWSRFAGWVNRSTNPYEIFCKSESMETTEQLYLYHKYVTGETHELEFEELDNLDVRMPVTGGELHNMGYRGAKISKILNSMQDDWIKSKYTKSKEELMEEYT